ncbi:MAG: thioredoxin reductase [Candidatus Parcubacteria bacterium]|nr:MAG: thioredoxin reductase [Candidatus Parcubacteria bacterium]
MIYQTIVLGLSAAGISSAIYLKRRGIEFIILGRDIGGEMALSGIVENYPGFLKTTGLELSKKFKQHLDYYKIQYIIDEVENIKKESEFFEVITKKNSFKSKSIIIATGSKPKKLNIPGEVEFYHKGVSYCSVCDLPLFKDKVVAIIGGGNSALEAGLMASNICKQSFIINKNPQFKGDEILLEELIKKNNIEIIYNSLTQEIYGDNFVKGIKYLDQTTGKIKTLDVEGVFIHIGLKPNTEFIPDEWNIKNSAGEIIINEIGETKIKGCFAAGDVTNIPYKQIGIAVGQGIIAALSNINFLNKNL